MIEMKYLVVVEKGEAGFGAYVPDLPGCVAAAESREQIVDLIREAMEFHIEGLKESGDPVPEPSSQSELIEIHAAQPVSLARNQDRTRFAEAAVRPLSEA